jgi:hypothetical protein
MGTAGVGALREARAAASPVAAAPLGPVAALLRMLRRDLRDEAAEALANLSGLLSTSGTADTVTDRASLLDQIGDVFAAVAQAQPLALVLDDLHWAVSGAIRRGIGQAGSSEGRAIPPPAPGRARALQGGLDDEPGSCAGRARRAFAEEPSRLLTGMATPVAVLDANVLFPAVSRDFFMRVHVEGVFQPKWTVRIHDEWMRNVAASTGIPRSKLERVRRLMDRHAGDAIVQRWQRYLSRLAATTIDPKDHHVVAAALKARADGGGEGEVVIVTANVRDFPVRDLQPLGLARSTPDAFALSLQGPSFEVDL